jgi:hypothetical protein
MNMKNFLQSMLILTLLLIFKSFAYAQENGDSSSPSTSSQSSTDPRYINGYNDGLAEGMAFCKTNPRACGISLYATSGRSEEEIIDETIAHCQEEPASCEIEVNLNTDGSTEAGKKECREDPASCNIDTETYLEEGRQQCRDDPASCNIDTEAYLEEGRQQCSNDPASCDINTASYIEQGRQQCINDPPSCGINVNQNLAEAIQETKAQCQIDPNSCGIEINNCPTPNPEECDPVTVHGFFSLSEGKLHLPAVDVPTAFDGTVTSYQVEMKQIPGQPDKPFLFSVINILPIEEESK